MKRLTTIQSGRMTTDTNESNIGTFQELLPHFLYDRTSNDRILDVINGVRPEPLKHTDEILGLDDQFRAWYEMPVNKEDNNAYEYYRLYLKGDDDLLSYDLFQSGRTRSGEKLFKYILKNNFMTQVQIDHINSLKNNESSLYFCISRNPIDYLMASTNQPWSSCLSLESEHDKAYYYSLASMVLDPSRAISFITPGKLRTYRETIKHFRYDQRQFLFIDANEHIYTDRIYPANKWSVTPLLLSAGYKTTATMESSYYPYHPANFPNSERALPFFDSIGITKGGFYSTNTGSRGGVMDCFSHSDGFFDFPDFDDIAGNHVCYSCGCNISDDESYHHDGGIYCDECYNENFSYCEHCNETYNSDDVSYVEDVGRVCQYCFDRNYFQCEHCDGTFSNDERNKVENRHGTRYHYCNNCTSYHTSSCDECGTYYTDDMDITEVDEKYLCETCLENGYEYCDVCEKYVENSEYYEEEKLCRECLINDHGYLFCYHCKTVHSPDTITEIGDKTFCETCLTNRVYCFKCRYLHHNNDVRLLNNVEIMPCETVYRTLKKCPVCSEYHTEESMICEYCENERIERIYSYVA